MSTLLERLTASLMPLPDRLLCGVSGGADSVALLRMLVLLRDENPRIMLTAIHVNHGLRGEASDEDERFVCELCALLQVPLVLRRAVLPANAAEDACRQARYSFFREAYAAENADALVLAHHMDDQAETVLEHLLRGAGPDGLIGMRAQSKAGPMTVLRPLLGIRREQLREALRETGQDWREDASNSDPRYLRNAIRCDLLPRMEQLMPAAASHIASATRLIALDADELRAQADRILRESAGDRWIRIAPLLQSGTALQHRVLRQWWQNCCGELQSEHALDTRQTEALCALLSGSNGSVCNLPSGWTARRGYHCLHLVPPRSDTPPAEAVQARDGACLGSVTLRILPADTDPGNGRTAQQIPQSLLEGCEIRFRRQGDRIRPFGHNGSQSLQDYLVNRKVDAPFRDRIPLLVNGNEVLLVCGIGAGAIPPVDVQATPVKLLWQGEMPWYIPDKRKDGKL